MFKGLCGELSVRVLLSVWNVFFITNQSGVFLTLCCPRKTLAFKVQHKQSHWCCTDVKSVGRTLKSCVKCFWFSVAHCTHIGEITESGPFPYIFHFNFCFRWSLFPLQSPWYGKRKHHEAKKWKTKLFNKAMFLWLECFLCFTFSSI